MDRDGLAALEKHVEARRVLAAERSVLAHSLGSPAPMRFGREIATAILAVCVLAAFLVGRVAGIFVATGQSCGSVRPGERVSISMGTESSLVTLDSDGNVSVDEELAVDHPNIIHHRVAPETVRAIANRLVGGCFFEKDPGYAYANDAGWVVVTLRVGNRVKSFRHTGMTMAMPMCGGEDLNEIEAAIGRLSRGES